MGLFNWLNGLFNGDDTFGGINSTGLDGSDDFLDSNTNTMINPASGLPMINGDTSGLDVAGNPFGMDNNSNDFTDNGFISNDFDSSDIFNNDSFGSDDSFGSSNSFDDFGSGTSGFGDDF